MLILIHYCGRYLVVPTNAGEKRVIVLDGAMPSSNPYHNPDPNYL